MPTMTHPPVIRVPGAGRTIGVVGDLYRFLATGAETAGRYAFFEAVVLPGGGPPPHIHSREEEGFLVVEGEVVFYLVNERIVAGPGTYLNMPIGSQHHFKNESNQPVRMLILVAPAGLEEFFFEVGQAVPEGAAMPPPPGPAEIEKLLATAPKYGLEILLP